MKTGQTPAKQKYTFKAQTKDGRTVHGEINAPNEAAVTARLTKAELTPVQIKLDQGIMLGEFFRGFLGASKKARPRTKELLQFFKKMQSLLNTGVALPHALEFVRKSSATSGFADVLDDIEQSIVSGISIKQAFSRYPTIFDSFAVNSIAAAEESGHLPEAFLSVYESLDRRRRLIKKIKSALSYPVMLIVASVGVIGFFMLFVVPKFQEVYKNANVKLPALTRGVVSLSRFTQHYWL